MARKGIVSNKGLHVTLPVLPVRDQVLFPGVVSTIQVARFRSREALQKAQNENRLLFVVTQTDSSIEDPDENQLCQVGTVCELVHSVPLPDGSTRVILRGLYRAKHQGITQSEVHYQADTLQLPEQFVESDANEAIRRLILESYRQLAGRHKQVPPESLESVVHSGSASQLTDFVAHYLPVSVEKKQALLETTDVSVRLAEAYQLIAHEENLLNLEEKLRGKVEQEIGVAQREYFLREQLKTIQNELSQGSEPESEADVYESKILSCGMSDVAKQSAMVELRRLQQSSSSSPEAQAIRNYLDILLSLPWQKQTEDQLELNQAESILDKRHFGLESVKERILEFLAVRKLKGTSRGAVLCFVGPPGVGKTSLAQTVAEALGRECVSMALGGVRDEAEIRGHRRTYVGSRPGRLIQALRDVGSKNPVVVLDEIDKIATGAAGDPTSALLEVLDPEQNAKFVDHFLEVPFDLSQVLFITTANILDSIPAALYDRLEIIEFPGYTENERIAIANQHIQPLISEESGLGDQMPLITEEAVRALVSEYTRESGVRALRREFAKIGRKLAKMIATGQPVPSVIDREAIIKLLGNPPLSESPGHSEPEIGTATGLVVTGFGGDRMQIEVSLTKPMGQDPRLILTGALGPVMQESVQTALTCVRRMLDNKGIDSRFDVHVHLPQAAIPKDGPSAGLTISIALYSAFTGRPVLSDVATTGEVTLRGHVLPVGGLREKLLAARRYGYRAVLFPAVQLPEVEEMREEVKEGLTLHPIANVTDGLKVALDYAQTVNMR